MEGGGLIIWIKWFVFNVVGMCNSGLGCLNVLDVLLYRDEEMSEKVWLLMS